MLHRSIACTTRNAIVYCVQLVVQTMLVLLLVPAPIPAQESDDDDGPRPGLIGNYKDISGSLAQRIDHQISFRWDEGVADTRLSQSPFAANWKGNLLLRAAGEYRFHLYVDGQVELLINGETLLREMSPKAKWYSSSVLQGRPGFQKIEIRYSKISRTGGLGLYWEGPQWGLEPIDGTLLSHDLSEADENAYDRGRQLVRSMRCGSCHDLSTSASDPASSSEFTALSAITAPSLAYAGKTLETSWVVNWLTDKQNRAPEERSMPSFEMSTEEAIAIDAFLRSIASQVDIAAASKKTSNDTPKSDTKKKGADGKAILPNVEDGKRLFVGLGCLACHSAQGEGKNSLYDGGNLDQVAFKRKPDFFAVHLRTPSALDPQSRMPQFDLSEDEVAHLVQYLRSLNGEKQTKEEVIARPSSSESSSNEQIDSGKELFARFRCGDCHSLDPKKASSGRTPRLPFPVQPNWSRSCIEGETAASTDKRGDKPPHYLLGQDELSHRNRKAIKEYVQASRRSEQTKKISVSGPDLLEQHQCLACHARGSSKGLTDTALQVASKFPTWVEHSSVLTPPTLHGIGDKLHDEAIRGALAKTAPNQRNWLQVRMPRFALTNEQMDLLTQYFRDQDRIPAGKLIPAKEHGIDPGLLKPIGARLVSSDGFGCMSCHAVHDVTHGTSPLSARGPNLGSLSKRIRPEWFYRWVKNPLRILPKVEMPSIVTPVPALLDQDLDKQLAALWDCLNQEDFRPPLPNAVRTVRHSGEFLPDERATLITEVVEAGKTQWIKPMLIGMPNRHNVLINLEEFRLEGWWIGDTARQRATGKRWYWEAGADNQVVAPEHATDLVLVNPEGEVWQPVRKGQFITEADQWRHREGGIDFQHRLHFESPDQSKRFTLHVRQSLHPIRMEGARSGWRRRLEVESLPIGFRLRLYPGFTDSAAFKSAGNADGSSNDQRLTLNDPGKTQIEIRSGSTTRFDRQGFVDAATSPNGGVVLELDYSTQLPVDRFPSSSKPVGVAAFQMLDTIPGFQARQLPLPLQLMPTGFAWNPKGEMIVTSLQGNVYRATDRDRDGWYDSASNISDELAVPFGAMATNTYVDVINKYALLRLRDEDGDGFAEKTETLASGWGHTSDYHDWAIGLPQTATGEYLVAFACQQDKRSDEAAHLRGTVARLRPRTPTLDNPQSFDIETMTAGHRFPIGIALNGDGEAFVTDNQGNYNPFNELNHLVPNARYGFINSKERSPGFQPKLTPPAIDIPHPWTRSVNGICFLQSPQRDKPVFGPFEGHLVGCEYDTQRLIRMSLQQVGNTIQGAAYPLSQPHGSQSNADKAGLDFLGPLSCAVSPQGELFVGNLRDSGWGAGQNIGNVVQMRFDEPNLPTGLAEVRAIHDGFELRFTKPIDIKKGGEKSNYSIASYTRVSTPQYGGEDRDRREEEIIDIKLDADARTVQIKLEELRKDHVYEFHLEDLAPGSTHFFPNEAHYTMRTVPD